jgi:amphi-Trp domain-containing protein
METAIAHLEELLKGLKAGAVYIQRGDQYVAVKPSKDVTMEVEAVEKSDKEKLTVELSWEKIPAPQPSEELKIMSSEPKQTAAAKKSDK